MEYKLPPLPTNLPNVVRRIRACEGEVAAQVVFEHALNEYAIAAIAAIEAQGVPDGWKPIATSPESMNECVVVGWIDDEGALRTEFDYKEDGCWIKWHEHAEHTEVIGGHGVSYTPPYTHWLKLPPLASAPPAPRSEKANDSDPYLEWIMSRTPKDKHLASSDPQAHQQAITGHAAEQASGVQQEPAVLGMYEHKCPSVTGHRGPSFVCQKAGHAVGQNLYCKGCTSDPAQQAKP